MKLSTHLDMAACPVPGSYAANVRATVRLVSGEERVFSLIYLKRYDVMKRVDCMRQEGWAPVDGWKFAEEVPLPGIGRWGLWVGQSFPGTFFVLLLSSAAWQIPLRA